MGGNYTACTKPSPQRALRVKMQSVRFTTPEERDTTGKWYTTDSPRRLAVPPTRAPKVRQIVDCHQLLGKAHTVWALTTREAHRGHENWGWANGSVIRPGLSNEPGGAEDRMNRCLEDRQVWLWLKMVKPMWDQTRLVTLEHMNTLEEDDDDIGIHNDGDDDQQDEL